MDAIIEIPEAHEMCDLSAYFDVNVLSLYGSFYVL